MLFPHPFTHYSWVKEFSVSVLQKTTELLIKTHTCVAVQLDGKPRTGSCDSACEIKQVTEGSRTQNPHLCLAFPWVQIANDRSGSWKNTYPSLENHFIIDKITLQKVINAVVPSHGGFSRSALWTSKIPYRNLHLIANGFSAIHGKGKQKCRMGFGSFPLHADGILSTSWLKTFANKLGVKEPTSTIWDGG